jgi:Pyridoxamine 5'-phosphate oxidase
MPTQTLDPAFHDLLQGRYIASLATQSPNGAGHLTAVWYLFDSGSFFVATSSKSRKARNVVARPTASLMVDVRKAAAERGITATGAVDIISGQPSRELNRRIYTRYLSSAAIADPHVEPVFASFDDITLRITSISWTAWDLSVLDAQAFGGRLGKTPGYLLPLD